MASNPINLALRFVLELAAWAASGAWGWHQGTGALRVVLALGIPLVEMVLWGTFRVPQDASSSGRAPVPVPGLVRLVLELAFFGFAVWALRDIGATTLSWVLAGLVLAHYLLSYDRLQWLLRTR
jgi:hypothetical protein